MPVWIATIIIVSIGLNPLLRLWVYPMLTLKSFIESMDLISCGLILWSVASLWALYGFPKNFQGRPEIGRNVRAWLVAVLLFPLLWIAISLLLYLLIETGFLEDATMGPLYDGLLYTQSHPISWTGLSFLSGAITEELFFRAWLPDFCERFMRRSLGILLSAMAFTAAHISLHITPLVATLFMLLALSLSYVRMRYGVRAAIGLHLINNLMVFGSSALGWNLLSAILEDPWLSRLMLMIGVGGLLLLLNDIRKMVDRTPYSLP